MIRTLVLIFAICLPIYASKIINYKVYEKEDAVDIMLSFDTPYTGKIIQKKDNGNALFILEETLIDEKVSQDIYSPIVQSFQLIPYEKQIFIELSGEEDFQVDASKTVDAYGLRLRITAPTLLPIQEEPLDEKISQIETKKDDGVEGAYLKMMLVLLALMGLLYFLKKWLDNRTSGAGGNWLFDKSMQKQKTDIKILQQRAIDVKNRIAVVGYGDKEYLLLLGSNNVLLDSFERQSKHHDNDFDSVLTENQDALSDFIQQKRVDDYKEKMSLN